MYKIEDEKYLRAKEKITEIKKFYSRLVRSLLLFAVVGGINYYQNEWEQPWFLWVVFGVGIGLAFKAIKVFGLNPFLGKNWEKRKIEQFMQEEDNTERWE
jgi:hypothetical protein